ncbi:MAG: hypothetical protein MO852_15880, partial [Candidatus Devosia euplotis]|nr:hypothetical protein [Candidatus Devosia euplotis]
YRHWHGLSRLAGRDGAMPGAAGIVMAGLLGLSWRYFLRPRTRVKARHLVVLGLVVSCYVLTGIGMGYAGLWALISMIGPYMVSASVIGSGAAGAVYRARAAPD